MDPITIMGIAASIMQIVSFAAEVSQRLKWCLDQTEDPPRALRGIQNILPALTETVKRAEQNAKTKLTPDETDEAVNQRNKALLGLTKTCQDDLDKLNKILDKVLPKADDKNFTKIIQALRAIAKDSKIERIRDRLIEFVQTIANHQTTHILAHLQVMSSTMPDKAQVAEITVVIEKLKQEVNNQPANVKVGEIQDVLMRLQTSHSQGQQLTMDTLKAILSQLRKDQIPHLEPIKEVRKPVDNIPELGVADFVSRKALSQKIAELLSPSGTRDSTAAAPTVVLKGMGGQGKTQLTIAYCNEALRSKIFHSIFWVDATSEASVYRSYEEIAERLTTPAPKLGTDKERKEFVETRLKAWDRPWLMVLDNYDNPEGFKKQKQGIRTFMPACNSSHFSHFLITSRHTASARLCQPRCVINVDGMTKEEAVDLFVRRSEIPVPPSASVGASEQMVAVYRKDLARFNEGVVEIVERLGRHALAIDLIGTYFKDRGLPLSEILKEYNRRAAKIHNKKPPAWLEYRKRLDDDEQEIALNVFTSIELSYEQLAREEPKNIAMYREMLALFAFLHDQELSEKIFDAQWRALGNKRSTYPKWLKSFVTRKGEWDHDKFVDMLVQLKDKLLISDYKQNTIPGFDKTTIATSIKFHPLVKDWLKLREEDEDVQSDFAIEATLMVQRFLGLRQNEVATFNMIQEEKREALSYVVACQENIADFCEVEGDDGSPALGRGDLADAGQVFALFLEYMGKIDDAHKLFKRMIEWQKKTCDAKDLKLLKTKSLFTEVLRLQKDFRGAEELDREVYQARLEILGPDDEYTLWSAHDLGWDLEALGDVEKAEVLQRVAYEGRKKVLGPSNPLVLQSINNLAHTLRRQGKTLEALELMEETLEIGREVFQIPHHSELLQFMSNLQDVLRFQGKLAEAEKLARESLTATVAEWGEDHLKAASSRGQLKDILWDRNDADAAEAVAKENLRIMATSPYSTDISRIDDIALLLDTLSGRQMTGGSSRRDEILAYAEEALGLVKGLSKESLKLPSTLQDLIYLATGLEVLRASKQLTELEPYIYENCKEVFGIADRNSINSLVRLSSALRVEKKHKEAATCCRGAIKELEKKVEEGDTGGTKSAHLAALSWLAVLHKHIGDQESAVNVYNRAFDYVQKDNFIADADYETLYSIQGLAEDIDDQRRCTQAEILHRAVLQTRETRYKEHPCVDDSLYAYSWNLRLQDRLTEAEKICQRALDIARKYRGSHRNTMCILKRLAYLEEQLGKHEAAEAHYREVLGGFRALGTRHMTRVTEALEDLQELLMEQRKWQEARALIQDAISRRQIGWDRNLGHHAGLIRHLAIVTWEIGDGIEGLKLYREARRTYEKAWGLHEMKDSPAKRSLIRRINELLPGTENMEEEMKIEAGEKDKAMQDVNEAAARKNANLDDVEEGETTPKAALAAVSAVEQDLKRGLGQVNQKLASYKADDGTTQPGLTSPKINEEAAADDFNPGGGSLSRSETLVSESLPDAPDDEPSKISERQGAMDGLSRALEDVDLA